MSEDPGLMIAKYHFDVTRFEVHCLSASDLDDLVA
jgi:hypothetical protein